MSTDLISLNYNSTNTLGSLANSSTSSTVNAAANSDGNSSDLGIQGDGKNFSKGAEMMQKLKNLQSSDPDKFKEVTQKISDRLSEAAKDSSDSNESDMLNRMAGQFAEAANSGSMSSLTPPSPPSSASGVQGQVAMKYAAQQQNGSNPMDTFDNILSGALSGVSSTEA